jgi:hypothetical protein
MNIRYSAQATRFQAPICSAGGCASVPHLRQLVANLQRYLRSHDVTYVRAEYSGRDGQGGLSSLHASVAAGGEVQAGDRKWTRHLAATFRVLLQSRHPHCWDGSGSCGDFRWNLQSSSLTHSHYLLGERNERVTHHGWDRT